MENNNPQLYDSSHYAAPAPSRYYPPMTENDLPEEYRPIGPWGYFGYNLLFAIPLVGFIMLLVYAFGGTRKVNLKNYARSFFCNLIIVVVLYGILFATGVLSNIVSSIR